MELSFYSGKIIGGSILTMEVTTDHTLGSKCEIEVKKLGFS